MREKNLVGVLISQELANHNQLQILDSTDILSINSEAKAALFDKVNVFARISHFYQFANTAAVTFLKFGSSY